VLHLFGARSYQFPNSRTFWLDGLSVIDTAVRFLTTFIIPYLLYPPYANLDAKVGFIFGSTAICALIFGYFCVPECKGRSLEEVDRLFIDGVPIRKFKNTPVHVHVEDIDLKENGKAAIIREEAVNRA
jgi:MFS transporter, SP family, sugar:H+ symporter